MKRRALFARIATLAAAAPIAAGMAPAEAAVALTDAERVKAITDAFWASEEGQRLILEEARRMMGETSGQSITASTGRLTATTFSDLTVTGNTTLGGSWRYVRSGNGPISKVFWADPEHR